MGENGNNALENIKGMIKEGLGADIDSEEIDSFMDFLATFTEYKAKNSEDTVDRTAAEFIFLDTFISDELAHDFPEIEIDFIRHCRDKLPQFGQAAIPLTDLLKCTSIINNHQQRVLASILCGAKSGDPYCTELLKCMYKTYHKKEYSQLKRYPKLTGRCIEDLCAHEYYEHGKVSINTEKLARVLTIAQFFKIPYASDCDMYFIGLKKDMDHYLEEESDFDCIEIGQEDIKNLKGKLRPALEAFVNSLEDGPSDGLRLAQEMMKIGELPPENISMCGTDAFAAYDLALIAKVVNIDEIDLEQLQLYAMICDLSRVLGVTLGFIEAQTREFLFQSVPEVSNLKVLQSLKNIRLADSVVKAENKASAKQKEPESTEAVTKTEDMLAELKSKIQDAVSVGTHFQEEYKKEKALREELEAKLHDYNAIKQELVALREFAYNSTEEMQSVPKIPIAEMKKAIANKRITIVGGNENWVKKIRQEFPNWKFVSANVSNTVDNTSILKAERVILFTDTLGHSNYYKFMQTIQAHNIPFSFLHGVNIDRNIIQIYEDVFASK